MTEKSPRGRLKILLGYAAGVGKTFKMLDEAHGLRRQGVDVVIGYFEPHGRQDTIARTEGLEIIPRCQIEYRGSLFEEMDTNAILARQPEVALVDEYPHTNVPGSERLKRWAEEYAPVHDVAHWDDARQRSVRDYDAEYENAAKRAERLLGRLGREMAPLFLELYPAVIWEDQDECLEVRPEDIPL